MANNPAKKNNPGSRAEQKAAAAQRRESRHEKAAKQAAALRAERARRQRRERLTVGAVVAVVLFLIAGIVWYQLRDTGPVAAPEGVTDDYGLAIGKADATHQVVVYEDFLCPACGDFEAVTSEPLAKAAEAGKARVTYFPINFLSSFGDYSERATNAFAVVLDASGPEVAKTFHDELFASQPEENGDKPDNDWLVKKAVAAGAKESDVRPGIEDGTFNDWVAEATDAASKAGVRQTPTVLLDGQQWSGSTYDELIGALG